MGWKLDQAGCYWQDEQIVSVVPTPLWDKHAWHPTRSIAQAMMVAERINELGYWMKLTSPFFEDEEIWYAGFTPKLTTGWNGRPDHAGSADTPALAICLAAKAWLEAREK